MRADKTKKRSAVEFVLDEIVNGIIRGELRPGERLPTETELSQKYGVGRNSVREAIKQLQAFGVLYIKRADGTYVADSCNQRMLDPVLYSFILQQRDWRDFKRLRAVIEIGVLHIALRDPEAARAASGLLELADEMDRELRLGPEPSVDRLLELDSDFHTRVAGILSNPQVDSITGYVTRLTAPSRRDAIAAYIEGRRGDSFVALHRQIADVVARRDTARIQRVIEEHYGISE